MNILVVCMGNTCRSPMIMAMLRQAHPGWKIESRGMLIDHEQKTANPNAITLFPELASHKPLNVLTAEVDAADLVVVVTPTLLHWLIDSVGSLRTPALVLDVPDPNGKDIKPYHQAVASARKFLIKAGLLPKES